MITIYLKGEIHTLDIADNKIFLDCTQVHIESVNTSDVVVSKGFELFSLSFENVYRAMYGGLEPSPSLAGLLISQKLMIEQCQR